MGISQMLTDVKAHLEQGAELAVSHIPALVQWAERAEADPLVQAAIDAEIPPSTRAMLAGLIKGVEAEVKQAEADAKAQAEAEQQAAQAADVPPA